MSEDFGALWEQVVRSPSTVNADTGRALIAQFIQEGERRGDPSLLAASYQIAHLLKEGRFSALNFMGTMGCGKSSLAKKVAENLGYQFIEADLLHTEESREKMSNNIPLEPSDRVLFLERVQEVFKSRGDQGVVCTCSALTYQMRQVIRGEAAASILPGYERSPIPLEFLDHGILFINVEKPYERALTQLDRSSKDARFAREFNGKAHFIKVTRENPLLLKKQYELLESPKRWEAITIDTEQYFDTSTERYDQEGMREALRFLSAFRSPTA